MIKLKVHDSLRVSFSIESIDPDFKYSLTEGQEGELRILHWCLRSRQYPEVIPSDGVLYVCGSETYRDKEVLTLRPSDFWSLKNELEIIEGCSSFTEAQQAIEKYRFSLEDYFFESLHSGQTVYDALKE